MTGSILGPIVICAYLGILIEVVHLCDTPYSWNIRKENLHGEFCNQSNKLEKVQHFVESRANDAP